MKITKEEIIDIATTMKFEVDEKDIKAIQETVDAVGKNLESLFDEETDGIPKMHGIELENQFNNDFDEEVDVADILRALNNFDGEYVRLEKGLKDEE